LLPEGFNVVPARHLSSGSRRSLRNARPHLGNSYVYHVTSHFAHRRKIIEQIYDHVAQEWTKDQLSPSGPFEPEIFPMRREIATLKAQLALAKAREEKARGRLHRMEHSLSWRITRPLRGLAQALARIMHHGWRAWIKPLI
jgi:hypothetical protein